VVGFGVKAKLVLVWFAQKIAPHLVASDSFIEYVNVSWKWARCTSYPADAVREHIWDLPTNPGFTVIPRPRPDY
jgi:hypothetical protein